MDNTPWLNYEAKRTGKTVEEIRKEMARRSEQVAPEKRGLANNPEAAKAAAEKRWANHRRDSDKKENNQSTS